MPRPISLWLIGFVALTAGAAAARAADCPAAPPASAKERRTLAKEWFTRAEASESGGDDVTAVKAYECSLRMVPHAFTAYNLARVAEKTGDLELALESYRSYLTMSPEAPDKDDVDRRIKNLETRIAAVRDGGGARDKPPQPDRTVRPPDRAPPPPPPPPPRTAAGRRGSGTDEPPGDLGSRMGITEWAIAGAGAASLVAGVVFNLGARSRMSDCRRLAASDPTAARSSCDSAKPFAYTSYALFGLAGAAAALDVFLILGKPGPAQSLRVTPLPGGGAVDLAFRF